MTYSFMLIIILLLVAELLLGAKLNETSMCFFDINNTKAMRGFWCFIIILVHVPGHFQNPIQDMLGSFAYIGVTFFFMTSGYGLTLSMINKPDSIKTFWRKHLPKLLITNWAVNLLSMLINMFINGTGMSASALFRIDDWVKWLLGCYVIFWLTQLLFVKNKKLGFAVGAALTAVCSVIFYFLGRSGIVTSTVWAVECLGFVWGIILAVCYDKVVDILSNNWVRNIIIGLAGSLALGVTYLKFKTVPVAGDYVLKILLGLVITIFILALNVMISIGNRISMFLGEISYEIYLSQWLAFMLTSVLLGDVASGVFIFTSLILAIILATICHYVTKPIVIGVNKIIFAGK